MSRKTDLRMRESHAFQSWKFQLCGTPVLVCSGHMGYRNSRAHGLQVGMPWKESSVMSERIKMILEEVDGVRGSKADLARRYGVSRKTLH